jgi:hypothetical protein
MPFTPFMWVSEVLSFSLQFIVLLKIRNPKSLRVLMLILCFGNIAAVLTRNHALIYWDQLWLFRMAAMIVFLWAVADTVTLPYKPSLFLRIPIGAMLYLFVPYWPLKEANGSIQMEEFRFIGLLMALFILVAHFVARFLLKIRFGNDLKLAASLMGCLSAEALGSGATLLFGVLTHFQMLVWWLGIAVLAAYAARCSGAPRTPSRALQAFFLGVQIPTAECAILPDGSLRLPLQCRLPSETPVSSQCSRAVQGRVA